MKAVLKFRADLGRDLVTPQGGIMSNFLKQMSRFITCEVVLHGKVKYFAKLDNSNWVAVKDGGDLDWVEMASEDFNDMLETIESIGASVRFTNHSAA